MNYSDILKELKERGLYNISVDMVIAVANSLEFDSLEYNVSDEEFDLLCKTVYYCWCRGECGYTQLISDVVVDLYRDIKMGYRNKEKGLILTKKYLEELTPETADMILNVVYKKYQEGLF